MDLERRYDGPVPPADPAMLGRPSAGARAGLFERLAGETRQAAAVRRSGVPAGDALTDRRLARHVFRLGFYREQGRAWWDVTP